MKILIDTHILIWLLEDNPKLSHTHKSFLEDINNQIFISQFSFIEIAIKLKLGKLSDFKVSIEEFINETEKVGINTISIESSHLEAYQSLPLYDDHIDPFDKFIIATALKEGLNIITADLKFMKYASIASLI